MANIVKTLREVAQAFQKVEQTIYRWRDEGMPIEADGTYDILKIGKWRGVVPKRAPDALTEREKDNVRSLTVATDFTQREISEMTGVSMRSVATLQKELKENQGLIALYKERQAEILAYQRIRVDGHLTDEKLEVSSAKEIIDMSEKLYRMQRLEEDKSTENVGVIVGFINKMKEEDE